MPPDQPPGIISWNSPGDPMSVCLDISQKCLRAGLSGIGLLFLLIHPATADHRFETAWAVCDWQLGNKPTPNQQIAACNIVIAAGPKAGNIKGNPRRGMAIYSGAFADRAQAYLKLKQYETAIRDLSTYLDLLNQSDDFSTRVLVCLMGYRPRAVAYMAIGAYDRALSDLDACEAHTSFIKNHGQLTTDIFAKKANMGLRGDIAMARKEYERAVEYYEQHRDYFSENRISAEKIALAKRLAADPSAPITPLPGPSLPPNEACKLFPNLC